MSGNINEKIKIKQLQLRVLDMKIEDSPYSRTNQSIMKKKEVLLKEINKLKQSQHKVNIQDV